MLVSIVIANSCLPHYVDIQCTTLTPEVWRSQTDWPIMNNDAIVCKVCRVDANRRLWHLLQCCTNMIWSTLMTVNDRRLSRLKVACTLPVHWCHAGQDTLQHGHALSTRACITDLLFKWITKGDTAADDCRRSALVKANGPAAIRFTVDG